MKKLLMNGKFQRYFLLGYTLFSFVVSLIYLFFNLRIYHINWTRYDQPGNYHQWADKKLKYGTVQLFHQTTTLHSGILISLLLLGIVVSLSLFFLLWRNPSVRTVMPLIATFGFMLPLFPTGQSNILIRLGLCYLITIIISVIVTGLLKPLEYQIKKSY